jgi:translation initiation factor IF-3
MSNYTKIAPFLKGIGQKLLENYWNLAKFCPTLTLYRGAYLYPNPRDRRMPNRQSDGTRINEDIHISPIRLVKEDGEAVIIETSKALQMARDAGLDLVEVSPNAKPPVCRIMDFGKYRYEQQKREKEAKKKQKVINIKEVKLRPNIEQHDFDVKLKNALRFVEEGNKVKVTIMFRGRELSHPELGKEVLGRVAEALGDRVSIERNAKLEGKNMTMIVAPKVQKASKPKQPAQES